MKYHISLSTNKRFVCTKIIGLVNSPSLLECLLAAQQVAQQTEITRHLLDLTEARNHLSTLENYHFAYHDMNRSDIDRLGRVALIVAPDDHTHDFFETLLRNNGRDVTLFTNCEDAERYLGE